MKSRDINTRYQYALRHEQAALEGYVEWETDWADTLMYWYKHKQIDMPDDEYRAAAFFLNKEYLKKPGSLTLLYQTKLQLDKEVLPLAQEKEHALDFLFYRYKVYARMLEQGAY